MRVSFRRRSLMIRLVPAGAVLALVVLTISGAYATRPPATVLTEAITAEAAAGPVESGSVAAAPADTPITSAPLAVAMTGQSVSTTAPAAAQPTPTLTQLGHHDLGGNSGGNVRALGGYAYVGTTSRNSSSGCRGSGAYIVDLADPANPRTVATAAGIPGTVAEDLVPIKINTPAFQGTLLAVGIQRCTRGAAEGGMALVDVTDPANPVDLSFFRTGPQTGGVHELDIAVQGDRVLALLAVPGSENGPGGIGDVRIVDITDPRAPVQLAHWGIGAALGIGRGQGCQRVVYAHSVAAGSNGTRAYVSYWDAGIVILDITDPAQPRVIGRATTPNEEGGFHSALEMGRNLLVTAEEVDVATAPSNLRLRATGGGGSYELDGCELSTRDWIGVTAQLELPLVHWGDGCTDYDEMVTGAAVLVRGGSCPLREKADRAKAAGARVLLVGTGDQAGLPLTDRGDPLTIAVIGIAAGDVEKLATALTGGPVSVQVPSSRPWGPVRIWDISDPAAPAQRSVFRTANAQTIPPSRPGGAYTVHNPLPVGDYLLASWYTDGVRLIDVRDPAAPVEVASWVPPQRPAVWGVARTGDLVLASDLATGLWVLRATGLPPAP